MNKQTGLIIFSCLYMLGIISFFSNYLIPFSVLVCLVITFLFIKKKAGIKLFITFLVVFFLGIFNSFLNLKYDDSLTCFADKDITMQAKVTSIPTNNIKDRTKFYAKVISAEGEISEIKNLNTKSLITINDKTEKLKNIKIGDTLKLNGRLKIPAGSANPSQFDYAKYLQFKKTFSLLYVNEDWEIEQRAESITGKVLSKLNDTRNKIISIHAQNIKSPMLEILGGIIFGDDAVNPDEETKASFINSGIFHILAASGMNVTLIFGIWFFFAKNLRFNYKFSIITGILLILFYTFMTGFGPPIIRATLMLTLILIGKFIDRQASTIALLFLVAFLMLLVNPLMLFDIGFQLSFIVTFALILTSPLLVFKFRNKTFNYILGACCIPVIAQIYAAPLQMFYFNTFTMYSVFANIAIIPVLSIVSFIGFISSILAMIPPIAQFVCKTADYILNPLLIYIVKVAEFFAGLPHSIIYTRKPMLFQILLYFFIVVSITLFLRNKLKNEAVPSAMKEDVLKRERNITYLFCILSIILVFSFMKIPDNKPEIIFFAVGNADCITVKSPDNKYFMIDTGKIGYLKGNSQAKNIMIKYMKDKGIKNIEALVLSHFDADHSGGAVDILKDINVKDLYITDVYEDTQLSSGIINYIMTNNINALIANGISKIYYKDDFVFTIIKPDSEELKTENQKSLIVHVRYKNQNFLFMGDGDAKSYSLLPDSYKANIAVMKSGHHGAKDTVNDEMAKNTDLFILSTGQNVYNHPHPDTIEVLERNNSKYLRTDSYNAIKIIPDGNEIRVYSYSPKYKKFTKLNLE